MAVQKGDKVAIHYIGRLKDGSEFDNSYENGEPIKFEVGGGMVIPGFDDGVIGMEIGDKTHSCRRSSNKDLRRMPTC